jgi:hypothetical protein
MLEALKPKVMQHMNVERRIKAREREAERRAKALERRIKAREREANARRRVYENEMREADGESGVGGLTEQTSGRGKFPRISERHPAP